MRSKTQEKVDEICKLEPMFRSYTVEDVVASSDYCFEEIVARNRKFEIITIRQLCMVLKFIEVKRLEPVAKFFNRDHSDLIHTISVVLNALQGFDKKKKQPIIQILQNTNSIETNVLEFEPKALLTLQAQFNTMGL